LSEEQIHIIGKYLTIHGSNEEKLNQIKLLLGENETGKKGIEELEFVYNFINLQPAICNLQFDFTLARGLNYYTGIIYEIKAKGVQIGSIGGGGRYDDLTGLFGVPNLPGVGISFGVDRIYDVMEELKSFPENVHTGIQVLFFNLGKEESNVAYSLMQQLRMIKVKCEIFHETAKFDKQFKYAEKKNIPYAVIIGTKEMQENTCVVKNLKTGEQKSISQTQIINFSFH
jgi:histidyl-tRNA synthetase